jgi:hypothetical protein
MCDNASLNKEDDVKFIITTSNPLVVRDEIAREVRRRAEKIILETHRCRTNTQRNIASARANELKVLADFLDKLEITS